MPCRFEHNPSRRAFLRYASYASALAASPVLAQATGSRIEYRANQTNERDGQPRGAVEVYQVDKWGLKTLLSRHPLSLSATQPRSLVTSPDTRFLIAAAFGGGIYNVFPIEPDGRLGSLKSIFKELGSGPHPIHQTSAHPSSLLFDTTGKFLLASDLGCDRVSAFEISSEGELSHRSSLQLKPGSGPGAITLNASGTGLKVRNVLIPGMASCTFDPLTGALT